MAVRIEYLLLFIVLVLLLSILGINPTSKEATSSKGDKELEFQNFSLFDIRKDEPAQVVSALKMVKHQNYLDMDDVDLKDENGYRLLSKKAIYEEDYIYMDQGVNVVRDDGLKFATKSLNYNLETKDVKTVHPFRLEFNSSIILGENLELNTETKKVKADNIRASIYFVPQNRGTSQE